MGAKDILGKMEKGKVVWTDANGGIKMDVTGKLYSIHDIQGEVNLKVKLKY